MECYGQFLFLEETFEGNETSWTENASTDGANGLNRESLPSLDVEKLRGKGTPLWTREVAQIGHGSRKF